MKAMNRALRSAAILLFASGAAALVYQVLWIKQLTLIVGVDVFAVTTAVSAFFGGLAAGGAVFGRHADRVKRPLRLYALLEAGVAVLALLTTIALSHAAAPFALAEQRVASLAWGALFLLVGIPAFLMGGTLPVLARSVAPRQEAIGATGGGLYAANTLGAIVGVLLTPFLLIPTFGVRGASFAAVLVNSGAALAALVLDRFRQPRAIPAAAGTTGPSSVNARIAIVLYAIAGAIALGYEVIWSQAIVQFIGTRSFAFAVVLATYLSGLVIGSALYARWADRVRDPWGMFGLLISAAGLIALSEVAMLGGWLLRLQVAAGGVALAATGSIMVEMCARFAVAATCMVLPPTVLLGAAFPLVLRLTVDVQHTGRDVGTVVAINTVGGIAGTMLVGFVLLPAIGLVRSLTTLAIAAAGLGVIAAMRGTAMFRLARWATAIIAAGAVAGAVVIPPDRLANLLAQARAGSLVFYRESRGGTVAVIEQRDDSRNFRRLYISGVSNSGDSLPSLRYMRLQALLPLILHESEPRSVLVIGLGTGITAGVVSQYPGLERRVCAELLPAVVQATPLFQGNYAPTKDSGLEIRLRDGRRELLASAERYDVITLEPPPPSAAGVVNLYSSDFYRLVRSRLEPGGIFAQWWPLPTQNDEDSRSLVRSFLDVFPHVSVWTTELHEMLLLGSPEPIELDVPRITTRFNEPSVAAALREVGVATSAALLATWVMGREELEKYAGDVPPVTDDRPTIEYASWVRPGEFQQVLPRVINLRSDPPVIGAEPDFIGELADQRETLLGFYEAGLSAYNGDRPGWAGAMRRVMSIDPENRYYRWVSGQ